MAEKKKLKTRDRILRDLKMLGPQSASQLAERIGVTAMAVRQHLYQLQKKDIVGYVDERRPVGRPRRLWRLTDKANVHFPDAHSDLMLGLVADIRSVFGQDGLDRLVAERMKRQARVYETRLPQNGDLEEKVAALADIRTEEGYMAEWRETDEGHYLLIENHCPICSAARSCQGLCQGEYELFQTVLGPDAHVERTEHILEGARRCVYKIAPNGQS